MRTRSAFEGAHYSDTARSRPATVIIDIWEPEPSEHGRRSRSSAMQCSSEFTDDTNHAKILAQEDVRRGKVRFGRKPGLGNRTRLCLRNYMEAEALGVYGGFHIVDTIPVFLPGQGNGDALSEAFGGQEPGILPFINGIEIKNREAGSRLSALRPNG